MTAISSSKRTPSWPLIRLINPEHAYLPWLVCFAAASFFFYEFIQMNMFDVINNALLQEFGITGKTLSNMSSVYFYACMIFLLPAGLLLDRVSTRKIILSALGLCVVATFAFAYASSVAFATLCRFAAGIGNAFAFLSCMVLASRWFPTERLALVTGLIVTFAMVGGAIAHTPLEILTQHLGWRNAVLVDGFIGLSIFLIVLFFVIDRPINQSDLSESTATASSLSFFQSLKLAIKNRQTWFCGLYTCILNLPLMVLGGLWGTPYLTQIHHFTSGQATTISSMLFIGTIGGSPAFGAVSDKIGRRRLPMLFGAAISLLLTLLLFKDTTFSFSMAMVLFFCIGFFTSSQVIGYPTITESNSTAITGTALGLASVLIMGGAGAFQQIFGYLIDLKWDHTIINNLPIYTAKNYYLALAVFPITLLIALFLVSIIKETFGHHQSFK